MPIACGSINVKDSPYNAYGDGTHDDSGAIQSAINAAAIAYGGTYLRKQVCIPAGKYRCDSGLTLSYGVSLIGHPGGTVLDFSNAGSSVIAIQWGTSTQDATHGGISGLTLYGPGNATSSIGIMAGDSTSPGSKKVLGDAMRDCVIRGFGTGVNLGSNCFLLLFEHVRLAYNDRGMDANGARTEFGENILFEHCTFDDNTRHFRVTTTGGQGLVFRNTVFGSANAVPESQLGSGTTVLFDKCTWDSSQVGSSGSPLLVDIVFRVATIAFRNCLFRLNQPSGLAVCWNSSDVVAGVKRITFDSCRVTGGGSGYFYGATASATFTPTAVAIQSPDVTGPAGLLVRIDP